MSSQLPPGGMTRSAHTAAARAQVRYQLFDLGTLGGPNSAVPESFLAFNGVTSAPSISAQGTAMATADTANADPLCYFDDCYYPGAIEYRDGGETALGALPNSLYSSANAISQNGLVAGQSENGQTDPLTGLPEMRAVIWRAGQITDLGTIDGGYNSFAFGVNNAGVAVGFANNTVLDPFVGEQHLAVRSQHGQLQNLGNLGGPDAIALLVNDAGQIAGASFTSTTPANCPDLPGLPPVHPFFWSNGRIVDIGTFGGDCGMVNALNNRGQVVGQAYQTGDTVARAFVWRGGVLHDLGTLGGSNASAEWMDDAGDIVGYADVAQGSCTHLTCIHHAFLYRNGKMTDLGTLPNEPCSKALGINARGQIVGSSRATCDSPALHALLWNDGGPPIDLNTVIAPGADLTLIGALAINDQGIISGNGVLANGDTHAFVLVPCASNCAEVHLGQISRLRLRPGMTKGLLEDRHYVHALRRILPTMQL